MLTGCCGQDLKEEATEPNPRLQEGRGGGKGARRQAGQPDCSAQPERRLAPAAPDCILYSQSQGTTQVPSVCQECA